MVKKVIVKKSAAPKPAAKSSPTKKRSTQSKKVVVAPAHHTPPLILSSTASAAAPPSPAAKKSVVTGPHEPIDIFKTLDANPLALPSAAPTHHGKSLTPVHTQAPDSDEPAAEPLVAKRAAGPKVEHGAEAETAVFDAAVDDIIAEEASPPAKTPRLTPAVRSSRSPEPATPLPEVSTWQAPSQEPAAVVLDDAAAYTPDTAPAYDPDNEPPIPVAMTHDQGGVLLGITAPLDPRYTRRVRGFVATLVFFTAMIAAYAGFVLWYNQPATVLAHAMGNMLHQSTYQLRGAYITSDRDDTQRLSFSLAQQDAQHHQASLQYARRQGAADSGFQADAIISGDAVAVRTDAAAQLLPALFGADRLDAVSLAAIARQADKRWVGAGDPDLKRVAIAGAPRSGDTLSEQLNCLQLGLQKMITTADWQRDMGQLSGRHPFVRVARTLEAEMVDGVLSNHYVLAIDHAQAALFTAGLQETSAFRAIDSCVDGRLKQAMPWLLGRAAAAAPEGTAELWVDTWRHVPTRLRLASADGGDSQSFEVLMSQQATAITVPAAEIPAASLSAPLSRLFVPPAGKLQR